MYKVIIIDDSKLIADSLAKFTLWSDYGCCVERVCYDGLSGKEAIFLIHPDIIIMDIQLPGLNGLDIIEMIKSQVSSAQIIFISAYDNFKYAQRALKLGAHDYLLKPFSQEMLRKSVESAVNKLGTTHKNRHVAEEESSRDENLQDQKNMVPIVNFIKQRLDQPLTAEEVAEVFCMSTSRLDKLLRVNCGMGFRDLRKKFRMTMAKELLGDFRYNISDVGVSVGYSSYVTFYRAFLREYGISPTEYRDKMQHGKGEIVSHEDKP